MRSLPGIKTATAFLHVATLMTSLSVGGCAPGLSTVRGSGEVTSASRPVGDFDQVELAGVGDLDLRQTGTPSLTIEADDNLLPLITSEVEGHRLVLGVRGNVNLVASKRIVYHVTVKDLSALLVSGSGSIHAADIRTDRLTVRISGSGDVRAAGRATDQKIDIAGSGGYFAADLDSTDATIHIGGSGSVVVKAGGRLDVHISGSGSVEYLGNPTVTSHVSGSGSIRQRSAR